MDSGFVLEFILPETESVIITINCDLELGESVANVDLANSVFNSRLVSYFVVTSTCQNYFNF